MNALGEEEATRELFVSAYTCAEEGLVRLAWEGVRCTPGCGLSPGAASLQNRDTHVLMV